MTKRKLKLWEALAVSLGLVGPTLAMSGNGQGIIGMVGKAVPLVFFLGFLGVMLVAFGFIRLTRRYNHAGSAYALVGATMGPELGFIAGFALFGCYLFFLICTASIFGAFVNSFLFHFGSAQIGFGISAAVCLALAGWLNTRDTSTVSRLLLTIEGFGITFMVILVAVIFGKGGAESTGFDISTFTSGGVSMSTIAAAVVAAVLSWAGFESCAALGEETDNPRHNIPRALFGSVLITGALFVIGMFAQTIGFGTDEEGLAKFQGSGNTLGDLGTSYVGNWFGILVVLTAVASAFACNLASVTSSARLMMALARDGFGSPKLAKVDPVHHSPVNAVWLMVAIGIVVNLISWLAKWPVMGTGNAAIDSYFFFAVVGSVCLLFAYLLVEVAVFAAARSGQISVKPWELLWPALGAVFILVILYLNLKGQSGVSPALVALIWVLIGVEIALVAGNLAKRIGESLTRELDNADAGHSELVE